MKKFLAFVLSLLMIMSCTSVVMADVTFDEGTAVAYEFGEVTVGEKVAVPVNLVFSDSYTGDIGTGKIIFTYDSTKLTYDSFEKHIGGSVNVNGKVAGTVQFNVTPDDAFTESTDLVTIYFVPVAGQSGDVALEFQTARMNAVSAEGNRQVFQAENGKVTLPVAEVAKYDVTFVSDYGTAPDAMTDIEAGTKITLVALDDTADFTFGGWTDGENEYAAGTEYEVTGDVTLTAIWNKIEKYDVTFVSDYGTAPEAVTDVVKGTKITLEALDNTTDFTFGGWTDGENEYAAGTEYEVTGDVTLTAIWNEIEKYTVTYSEGAEAETVVAGQSVTVPTLTKTDLVFKGWKVGDTDEIVAGGAEFIPTASVLLTAQWKSAGKVYLSDNGDDTADGLTAETAVKTIVKAMEIAAADEDIDMLVIVDSFTASDKANKIGVAGKTLTITGNTAEAVFRLDWPAANHSDGTNTDDMFDMNGPVVFENIALYGDNNDGRIKTRGYKLVIGEGVTDAGKATNISVETGTANSEIEINSGYFGRVFPGNFSGGTFTGNTTIAIGGDSTKVETLGLGHGWRQTQNFSGIYNVIINGGTVTKISLQSGGTGNLADNGYRGLRYYTINDGTVGAVVTTSSPVWGTVKDGANAYSNVAYRQGVTVFEINKAGVVTGTIDRGINIETKEKTDDDATRIIIFNNGSYEEGKVLDTGAFTFNVLNGALKADVTVAEDGFTTTLNGFSYEFAEAALAAEYNAVKVGDKTYMLAELTDDLIPAPEAADVYDVEFTNVYKVTIGEETTLVEEGDTIALTRLPQNGDLKHIGWATTEDATEATIDHTTDYAPTADVTLYPVWAAAVYFTATFESEHGEVPAPISKIDDDEDGKADEAITFPGYEGKQDEHFTFAGWCDRAYEGAPEGTVIPTYNEGDTLVLEGNKTFIAMWTEDAKATVTYVDAQATAPEAVTDYVGTEITIAAPGAVEGLEFLGWTDGTNVYQAGDKLIIDEDGATLTAKWGVKIPVDANGAKGEAPVIGGAIGEEIDLPTEVPFTRVNSTFVGWATAPNGEVITGKYTVNAEDTLYAIWEEVVADAAIIETKVVYNSATNDYTADMYFYGADANTVAFGYRFGENLEFVSFEPAADLSVTPDALEVIEDGYYAYAVTNQNTGKIEGASASAGNGVHLGTITLAYTGTKEDYSEDDAADNIAITAPKDQIDNVSSAEYFLYTPAVAGLEVIGLPIVFDEAIEYEIVDVVYTVKGSVKVVRADGTAPKNFAEIEVYNEQGNLYKTFVIEDAETTTVDGVFNYEIGLGAGKYKFVVNKTGYLASAIDVEIAVQDGADEEGFVPTPVEAAPVELIPGDVVEVKGVIDLLDFAGITSMFSRGELPADITLALDIDEDGLVTVFDLGYIKTNYSKTSNIGS